MISFTEDQATALVTDAGTLKRGRELAAPAKWANLGRTDSAAWGECAGSGSKPYLVGIDLTEPVFKCSCPSRVFPCKHGAGLLLLLARQPALLPASTPPAWLAEWLDKRQAKSTAQAEKAGTQAAPTATDETAPAEAAGPTPAQRKREAQRHARMQAGAAELETWLLDLLRAGLAELPKQKQTFWESMAARLVDNQLPGLAATLRELAELPTAGPAWAERLLGRLGELHVLVRAFLRREALGPAAQQEVWQQVGITPKKDELLARPDALVVADTWLVLGQYAWEEERLLARRSWLYGQRSGRTALLVDFAFGNQPFATALVPQGKYVGELVFYPGLLPLRAAPVSLAFQGSGAEAIPPSQTISQLLGTYAAALARQPWLRQWPAALGPARLHPLPDGRWLLHHATEPLTLPLRIADEEIAWQWLAFGGGQPLTFFGDWDGQAFCPLVCWREDVDAAGNVLVLDDFFVASGSSGQPVGALAAIALPAASAGSTSATTPAVPAAAEAPAWPPLLRLALLGTRQSAEALPGFPGLPAANSREQQLLLTAGTLALMQKAGYKPTAAAAPALAPAPPDALPPLGPLGAECLHRMVVSSQHLDLLPAYLHRVAAAGRRVPEMLLMPLLQHATTSVAARADLGAVLGERGRWLAALNPAWVKLFAFSDATADPADAAAWETGRPAERLAWLRQRFAHDADAARTLLLAALPTEPAKMQEELLHLLAEHPHPAAEPVLEGLLKARGQEVRRQAAALLVRLPGAALTERLWARAAPLITAKRGLLGLGKVTLEITLPTAWDKSWLADGIEEQNSAYVFSALDADTPKTVGPAAARLGNLLALLPPSRWTAHLKLTASELLTAALASEWPVSLLLPWAQSTLLHQDVDFAAAFMQLWMHQRLALTKAKCIGGIHWVALANLLPAADRQEALFKPVLLRVRRQEPDWLADLGYVPAPWPRPLTEAALDAISGQLANTALLADSHSPLSQLRQLVWQLPQAIAPNVALSEVDWVIQRVQAIEQPHPTFLPYLHTLMDTLRFRAELEASLRE